MKKIKTKNYIKKSGINSNFYDDNWEYNKEHSRRTLDYGDGILETSQDNELEQHQDDKYDKWRNIYLHKDEIKLLEQKLKTIGLSEIEKKRITKEIGFHNSAISNLMRGRLDKRYETL